MHRLPFVHRATALGTTATLTCGTTKGCRFHGIDDVDDDAAGLKASRIHGQGIAGLHT